MVTTHSPEARRPDRVAPAPGPLRPSLVLVLVAVVACAAGYGLVADDAYRDVPELLRQTWRAQDAVTLATLPLLVWWTRRARSGSWCAQMGVLGLLAWVAYSYAHLAFGTPFNPAFLLYVAALGLAGFALLDGLVRMDVAAVDAASRRSPRRGAGWFLLVAGVGIAALWLSDIALGLTGGVPANLHLAGLPNPTWVLDLAWLIPLAVGAGVLLLRRRTAGPLLAGVLLVMLLVLSAAMLLVTPFALAAGLGDDAVVAPQLVAFTVVFGVLGAVEAWLLVAAARSAEPTTAWWRSTWWPSATDGGPASLTARGA